MSRVVSDVIETDPAELVAINAALARLTAEQRIAWALQHLPGTHILSSSFGAQAAVSLHMVAQQQPDVPVVLIDTGYLFAETYAFVDDLTTRLRLNLKVYQSLVSPAWQEARHGPLWEQGVTGIERYNQLRKVEPMQRALAELDAGTWIAGLRRQQSRSRAVIDILEHRHGRWKLHPLADWTDRDIGQYLKRHRLPYHPLWEQGYLSIGDRHTSHRWEPGMEAEDTRFFGLKRECGLHSFA